MRRRLVLVSLLSLVVVMSLGEDSAGAKHLGPGNSVVRPSPSASPGERGNRAGSGYLFLLVVLGGALVWQTRRVRRSADDYALRSDSHLGGGLEPDEERDVRKE